MTRTPAGVRKYPISESKRAFMQATRYLGAFLVCGLAAAACGGSPEGEGGTGESATAASMNKIAEQYVRLALAVGQHDTDYVDAYYGPPEWKPSDDTRSGLDELVTRAEALAGDIQAVRPAADEMEQLRHRYLQAQVSAMNARLRMLGGERLSFDEESQALYDATAPTLPESHFQQVLDRLDQRFRGARPSSSRKRSSMPSSGRRSRPAASGRRPMCSCRRVRASRSNTSPTSPGAATTGIRAATAA
jgi:hypothetical protein